MTAQSSPIDNYLMWNMKKENKGGHKVNYLQKDPKPNDHTTLVQPESSFVSLKIAQVSRQLW